MPVIPFKAFKDRSKRPVVFDKDRYRNRNSIERLIGWLREYRRIFSRYEKSAKNLGGKIHLDFIQRYYRTSPIGV
jgi:transposase